MFWRFVVFISIMVSAQMVARSASIDRFDTRSAEGNINQFNTLSSEIRQELDELKKYVSGHNPELYKEISDLDENQQLIAIRSWLAVESFNWFYDKYMADIKQRAKETGRKLKKKTIKNKDKNYKDTTYLYWLDRGNLDKKKCKQSMANHIACDFPDGYEEYYIQYRKTINKGESKYDISDMAIIRDDKKNDKSESIIIALQEDSENLNFVTNTASEHRVSQGILLSLTENIHSYTEYHAWRNQEAADIRAGKYIKLGEPTLQPDGSMLDHIGIDTSRTWKSDQFPDTAVFVRTFMLSQEYTNLTTTDDASDDGDDD